MPVGGPEGLVGLVVLLVFLPLVAAVRDWRRWPSTAWRGVGGGRWSWLVVVVVLPLLGPVFYARHARPRLRAAASRTGLVA